jgi:hypothetical protein
MRALRTRRSAPSLDAQLAQETDLRAVAAASCLRRRDRSPAREVGGDTSADEARLLLHRASL